MSKYLVVNTCYGFLGQYWTKGQVVEIDPASNPPAHFKLYGGSGPAPAPQAPAASDKAEEAPAHKPVVDNAPTKTSAAALPEEEPKAVAEKKPQHDWVAKPKGKKKKK